MIFKKRNSWDPPFIQRIKTKVYEAMQSAGRRLNPVRCHYKKKFEGYDSDGDIDAFIETTNSPRKLYRLVKYVRSYCVEDDHIIKILQKLGKSPFANKIRKLKWHDGDLRLRILATFEEWDDYYREIEEDPFSEASGDGMYTTGKDWRGGFYSKYDNDTLDLICKLTPPKTNPRLQKLAMRHRSLAFRDAILKQLKKCPLCNGPFEERKNVYTRAIGYPTDSDFRRSEKCEIEETKRYFFCPQCNKNLSEERDFNG